MSFEEILKMRRDTLFLALVGLVLALSFAPVSFAQEGAECDLQQIKSEYLESIDAAQSWDELLAALGKFQSAVAVCNNGYVWSGYGDGSIGPIDLEQGTYILEFESLIDMGEEFNYFNVHLEGITDNNESDRYIIDHGIPGDPDQEGEILETNGSAVLRLNGGKYLFNVEILNYREWSIKLYRTD
jgi:hypothetical protein